jgi:hypothetical protein
MADAVLIEGEKLKNIAEELSKIVETNIKVLGIKLKAWRRQNGSVISLNDFGVEPGTNFVALAIEDAIILIKWRE